MADLAALYQDLILDHNRNPRHFGRLAAPTHAARRENPFCGDAFGLYLELSGDRVARVAFDGAGCAISKASASMLTVSVEQRSLAEIDALRRRFERLIRGETLDPAELADLGPLAAFAAVQRFPARVACARLAWEALAEALART